MKQVQEKSKIATGMDISQQLLKDLGLEDKQVTRIQISMNCAECMTLNVTRYLSKEELEAVSKTIHTAKQANDKQ